MRRGLREHEPPSPLRARRAPASPLVPPLYCNHMTASRVAAQKSDAAPGGTQAEEPGRRTPLTVTDAQSRSRS